jgi:hypothetical protein
MCDNKLENAHGLSLTISDKNYGFLFSVGVEGCAVPGIDFRALRSMVSIADVLFLVDFVPSNAGTTQMRLFREMRVVGPMVMPYDENTGSSSLYPEGPAMPGIDFRQVRANVCMAEVLELLGFVILERSGDQVRGECPLHEASQAGKHRSFSAHLSRGIFRCFKCGASGNPLDLWAKATKQSTYEAALDLCARLNKETPWLSSETEKRNS